LQYNKNNCRFSVIADIRFVRIACTFCTQISSLSLFSMPEYIFSNAKVFGDFKQREQIYWFVGIIRQCQSQEKNEIFFYQANAFTKWLRNKLPTSLILFGVIFRCIDSRAWAWWYAMRIRCVTRKTLRDLCTLSGMMTLNPHACEISMTSRCASLTTPRAIAECSKFFAEISPMHLVWQHH